MKKLFCVTAAGIFLAMATLPAAAQDTGDADARKHTRGGFHHRAAGEFGDPERLVKMLTRHLELDDSQSQEVGNVVAAAKPELDALRERLRAARERMHELDVDSPDYGSELQNLATEFGAATTEAALLHGRVRADVLAVLTPEQRELAKTARENMRGRRGGHRRHGQSRQ